MALKSTIAEMLGGSPFQPLKHHMASVMACVDHLPRFVEAVIARDWVSAATLREAIADGDGDRARRAMEDHLLESGRAAAAELDARGFFDADAPGSR